MKVLMVGVGLDQKGGMLTVVENYLHDDQFTKEVNLKYFESTAIKHGLRLIAFNLKQLYKFFYLMKNERFDIVHIHTSERLSIFRKGLYQKIAHKFGAKTILHMHGANIETWYEKLNPLTRSIVRKIFKESDTIIVLGEIWRIFFARLVNSNTKVVTLYNAVTTYGKNYYNLDSTTILFLGTINHRKGVPDIIKAIDGIDHQLPKNISFDFYGRDEEMIFKNFDSSEHSPKIHFKGWVDLNNKENLFSNVLANILPSYNEGLPMTILETMAFGIPNISTPVAAIPEVIIDGDNGILISPGNIREIQEAILTITKNKEERLSMSERAFETINKNFSLDLHIRQVKRIYFEILGR